MSDLKKYTTLLKDYKIITYPSLGVMVGTFVYSLYILFFLEESQKTSFNYLTIIGTSISIIGSFASIVGLVIAYFQILAIKKVAEQTNLKVEESIKRMNEVLIISELSKSVQMLREIQGYINDGKLNLVQMRMKDLKPLLIQVKYNQKLKDIILTTSYKTLLQDFGLNLENINSHIIEKSKKVDVNIVDKNIEALSTTLIHFEKEIINTHGKT